MLNYWRTLVKESNTKKLINSWHETFADKDSRHFYMDDFLDSYLGMQIRSLREERGLTQTELGEKADMHQTRISLLESMDYSGWSLDVLRRLAKAFDLRLVVKFEDFASYVKDYFEFDREHLQRRSYDSDVVFSKASRNKAIKSLQEPETLGKGLTLIADNPASSLPAQLTIPFQKTQIYLVPSPGGATTAANNAINEENTKTTSNIRMTRVAGIGG